MNWLYAALAAYILLAASNTLDKFLLDKVVNSSRAYVFAACLLGGVVVIGAPFFCVWPGWLWWILDLIIGGVFVVALWALYESLRRGEASRTLVFIGGLVPAFSLILSAVFLGDTFSRTQLSGIACLLIGVFTIAFLPQPHSFFARVLRRIKLDLNNNVGGLGIAAISALAYAVYFVATKAAYEAQPFASAFIWNRVGAAFFVLLFLLNRKSRTDVLSVFTNHRPGKRPWLVIFNQGLGSAGFILQNFAVSLGPVAIVNALQGVQYALLIVVGSVLAAISPKFWKEEFSPRILTQKFFAVSFIAIGLYFIIR